MPTLTKIWNITRNTAVTYRRKGIPRDRHDLQGVPQRAGRGAGAEAPGSHAARQTRRRRSRSGARAHSRDSSCVSGHTAPAGAACGDHRLVNVVRRTARIESGLMKLVRRCNLVLLEDRARPPARARALQARRRPPSRGRQRRDATQWIPATKRGGHEGSDADQGAAQVGLREDEKDRRGREPRPRAVCAGRPSAARDRRGTRPGRGR